jgi:hypothetical protein
MLSLILLVAAFAVAQDPTSPSAPASSNPTQSQSQPASPSGQATSPSSPSAMPMAAGEITEGCLGGSNPNYTVTDKAGTVYQLQIPKGADASPLDKHIGESVQVQGTKNDSGSKSGSASDSSAAASSSQSSAASAHSIQVSRIGRGTSTCPASGSTNTVKPPSK